MNLETADVPLMSRSCGNPAELIDSAELADRWRVPESWIRNHTPRSHTEGSTHPPVSGLVAMYDSNGDRLA